MSNPRISVIIPCYNVEQYVGKCLDSIVDQTYKNLEIICVNDGSTDGTREILKEYSSRDDRIVLIDQINTGASEARNNALKVVTGDYIAFVDGDDWIDEKTFSKAIQKVIEYDCDLVFWSYNKCYNNDSIQKYIYGNVDKYIEKDEYKDFYRTIFGLTENQLSSPELADSLCTVWGKLYNKKIFSNINFIDLNEIGTFEDGLFNIQCLVNGRSAYYISECLYNYRKDNVASITTKYKSDLFEKWQNLFDLIRNFIMENNLDDSFSAALDNRIALSIIGLGLNELSNPKGFLEQIKNLKFILSNEKYRIAYKKIKLNYFPIHWQLFFLLVKMSMVIPLYILLKIINILRSKG